MQGDSIAVRLNMPELLVEGQRQDGDTLMVTVRYRCASRPCPRCGRATSRVHQYHRQIKNHAPIWGHTLLLEMRKRRFRCAGCGCVFMERDEVCGWRRRSTRVFRGVLAQGCRSGTVKAVAAGAQVSEALVRRSFGELASGMLGGMTGTPQVLALDECYTGAKGGYLTVLYAPEERKVVQLALGRTQASAEALLNQLPDGDRVEAVVMDMTEGYRQAVRTCCPQAAIVVDKFHLLRHVLRAVERVCGEVRAQAAGEDVAILRRRSLFTASPTALTPAEREQRDRMLARYPALGTAWEYAQGFRRIYGAGSRAEAARALEDWWRRARAEGPRAFLALGHLLSAWREELLNYLDHPATNGFAEGKNNRIKVIIRSGYGYRNMTNLTQRILMTNHATTAARRAHPPHFLT